MKLFLPIFLLALSGISAFAQQAISNGPPTVFGPVATITYKYQSYTFSRDKTRIDEGVSNGRKVVWLFTAEGKLLTSEIFEEDGRSSGSKRTFNYDSSGRLISMIDYLLGRLSYTETYAYPAERQVKITRVFEPMPMSSTEVETRECDKAGHIAKATFQGEETSTRIELYKYDDKGNPTEFTETDGAGERLIKETYKYKFDKFGNWTERRTKSSSSSNLGIPPTSTTTRKLTYYVRRSH